jgi:hypothetical protein
LKIRLTPTQTAEKVGVQEKARGFPQGDAV